MQHPENKDQKGKSENYICAKLHSYSESKWKFDRVCKIKG